SRLDVAVPELPEVEAWTRLLDPDVKRSPIAKAGPAHIATLKTFDPPLAALEGEGFAGARRRAKRLLFPTDDGELVLMVHLMSAGRIRYIRPGEKSPKTPEFRLRFADGGELVMTEGGRKKRAGVWLMRPDQVEAELAYLGPEADTLTPETLAPILASDSRRLHSLLRDQRAIAGIGRAWANEILNAARLSPYALSTTLDAEETARLAAAIRSELARGLELRLQGAGNPAVYRVHDRLGEPCPNCRTPLARVDFEEHTIYYCPPCQTGGRVLAATRLAPLPRGRASRRTTRPRGCSRRSPGFSPSSPRPGHRRRWSSLRRRLPGRRSSSPVATTARSSARRRSSSTGCPPVSRVGSRTSSSTNRPGARVSGRHSSGR